MHVAVEIAAIGLALLLAFVPRGPRTTAQVAALGAAILIALQLGAVHWFYLYIPWFAALVLVALFAADRAADDPPAAPGLRQDADAAPEPTATPVPA